jgi:mannose-6-phosphate isomerase
MQRRNFTEKRPWGGFTNLLDLPTHKVKEIVVNPNQRLSYQRHSKRAEHWFVISGTGYAIIDEKHIPLSPGTAVDIKTKEKHRLGNDGNELLIVIEVQTGTYFGEDDIERFDDDYNRIS